MTLKGKRGALLGGAGLSAILLLAGAAPAFAEPWDDCRTRVVDARDHLDRAIHRHGVDSEQARRWRHEVEDARAWCWEHHHGWWDADAQRWRTDHW